MNIQQHIKAVAEQLLVAFDARNAADAEIATKAAESAKEHAASASYLLAWAFSNQEKATEEWRKLQSQVRVAHENAELAKYHADCAVESANYQALLDKVLSRQSNGILIDADEMLV